MVAGGAAFDGGAASQPGAVHEGGLGLNDDIGVDFTMHGGSAMQTGAAEDFYCGNSASAPSVPADSTVEPTTSIATEASIKTATSSTPEVSTPLAAAAPVPAVAPAAVAAPASAVVHAAPPPTTPAPIPAAVPASTTTAPVAATTSAVTPAVVTTEAAAIPAATTTEAAATPAATASDVSNPAITNESCTPVAVSTPAANAATPAQEEKTGFKAISTGMVAPHTVAPPGAQVRKIIEDNPFVYDQDTDTSPTARIYRASAANPAAKAEEEKANKTEEQLRHEELIKQQKEECDQCQQACCPFFHWVCKTEKRSAPFTLFVLTTIVITAVWGLEGSQHLRGEPETIPPLAVVMADLENGLANSSEKLLEYRKIHREFEETWEKPPRIVPLDWWRLYGSTTKLNEITDRFARGVIAFFGFGDILDSYEHDAYGDGFGRRFVRKQRITRRNDKGEYVQEEVHIEVHNGFIAFLIALILELALFLGGSVVSLADGVAVMMLEGVWNAVYHVFFYSPFWEWTPFVAVCWYFFLSAGWSDPGWIKSGIAPESMDDYLQHQLEEERDLRQMQLDNEEFIKYVEKEFTLHDELMDLELGAMSEGDDHPIMRKGHPMSPSNSPSNKNNNVSIAPVPGSATAAAAAAALVSPRGNPGGDGNQGTSTRITTKKPEQAEKDAAERELEMEQKQNKDLYLKCAGKTCVLKNAVLCRDAFCMPCAPCLAVCCAPVLRASESAIKKQIKKSEFVKQLSEKRTKNGFTILPKYLQERTVGFASSTVDGRNPNSSLRRKQKATNHAEVNNSPAGGTPRVQTPMDDLENPKEKAIQDEASVVTTAVTETTLATTEDSVTTMDGSVADSTLATVEDPLATTTSTSAIADEGTAGTNDSTDNAVYYVPQVQLPNGESIDLRYCDKCNIYQPIRTRHCHDCGRCTRCFDHHCPWIGNCVGENNRRYFLPFLYFQCLLLLRFWVYALNALSLSASLKLILAAEAVYNYQQEKLNGANATNADGTQSPDASTSITLESLDVENFDGDEMLNEMITSVFSLYFQALFSTFENSASLFHLVHDVAGGIMLFFFTLMTFCMGCFHTYLVAANLTTWEVSSGHKITYVRKIIDLHKTEEEKKQDEEKKRRVELKGSPFSKGLYLNVAAVFCMKSPRIGALLWRKGMIEGWSRRNLVWALNDQHIPDAVHFMTCNWGKIRIWNKLCHFLCSTGTCVCATICGMSDADFKEALREACIPSSERRRKSYGKSELELATAGGKDK